MHRWSLGSRVDPPHGVRLWRMDAPQVDRGQEAVAVQLRHGPPDLLSTDQDRDIVLDRELPRQVAEVLGVVHDRRPQLSRRPLPGPDAALTSVLTR